MRTFSPLDWALFILRLGAGITIFAHGYQKLFPAGPIGFAHYLQAHHFPAPLFFAWIMTFVEFGGGLALLAGFQVKWVGAVLALERVITAVRLKMVAHIGFTGSPRGIGWEFDFLLLCMVVAVAMVGAGAVTLETALRSRRGP